MKTFKNNWSDTYVYIVKDSNIYHGLLNYYDKNYTNSRIGYWYQDKRKGFWLRLKKEH